MSNLGFWPVDVVKTVITRPSLTSHLSGWATRFKNSSKAVAGLGIAAIGEIRGWWYKSGTGVFWVRYRARITVTPELDVPIHHRGCAEVVGHGFMLVGLEKCAVVRKTVRGKKGE